MSVVSHWLQVKMKIMAGDFAEVMKTSLGDRSTAPKAGWIKTRLTHLVCVVNRPILANETLRTIRHCCNVAIVGGGETADVGRYVIRCHFLFPLLVFG